VAGWAWTAVEGGVGCAAGNWCPYRPGHVGAGGAMFVASLRVRGLLLARPWCVWWVCEAAGSFGPGAADVAVPRGPLFRLIPGAVE